MGHYCQVIEEETRRCIWNLGNVIAGVTDEVWQTEFCGQPGYKHVYHTIHSLDQWYINPCRKDAVMIALP